MTRRVRRVTSVFVAVAALAAASAGCAGRVDVTGRVVEKGAPIAGAELRWASESDKTLFVSGASDDAGKYVLDSGGKRGVPPGRYRVTVTWWRMRDGKALPAGEQGSALKGTRKAVRYEATLDVEVTKASDTFDLDVTGKAQEVKTPD